MLLWEKKRADDLGIWYHIALWQQFFGVVVVEELKLEGELSCLPQSSLLLHVSHCLWPVTFLASEDMWIYDSRATRSGRSISALVVTDSNNLEQHYTKELSVMMEMADVCLGQYSSHLLWVAFEQLKCGWLEWRWAVSRKWTPDFQNWVQTSKGKNISLIIFLCWLQFKGFTKLNKIFY